MTKPVVDPVVKQIATEAALMVDPAIFTHPELQTGVVTDYWEIQKDYHFSASHQLLTLPDTHPCHRMHGHNYVVRLILSGRFLNGDGFIRDYGELSPIKVWIDETLDHRHLNDVMQGITPSAENIARFIYRRWKGDYPELHMVGVSETPKTWAFYRQDGIRIGF